MNLELQVCSLELAKRLKELGVKQESYFYYRDEYGKPDNIHNYKIMIWSFVLGSKNIDERNGAYECISAFTASELLNILPRMVDTKINEPFNNYRLNMTMSLVVEDNVAKRVYLINYDCDIRKIEDLCFPSKQLFQHNIWDKNLANALAKTLIYLIENGLLKNDH